MYYNKYLKYKIKYNQKIIDIVKVSYNKINKILDNLDKYYHTNNLIQYGGNIKNYKKFIKKAKSIIIYYKNIAKEYYLINVKLYSQINKLLYILKKRKKDFFDSSIYLLQDSINNNIEFNLNIIFDDNNIKGGEGWDINTFQEKLTSIIGENNVNSSALIQEKINKIYEKLKSLDSFVEIITKLKELDNNINLFIDKIEKEKKITPDELLILIDKIISIIKEQSPDTLVIIFLNLEKLAKNFDSIISTFPLEEDKDKLKKSQTELNTRILEIKEKYKPETSEIVPGVPESLPEVPEAGDSVEARDLVEEKEDEFFDSSSGDDTEVIEQTTEIGCEQIIVEVKKVIGEESKNITVTHKESLISSGKITKENINKCLKDNDISVKYIDTKFTETQINDFFDCINFMYC